MHNWKREAKKSVEEEAAKKCMASIITGDEVNFFYLLHVH
jgi:hypothetical protein